MLPARTARNKPRFGGAFFSPKSAQEAVRFEEMVGARVESHYNQSFGTEGNRLTDLDELSGA